MYHHAVQYGTEETYLWTAVPPTDPSSGTWHRQAIDTCLQEDATQTYGQPAAGATTMCEYVVDRWEREVEQLEH